MEPTLKSNEEVLVSSIPYLFGEPKINDIILFSKNNKKFIKRIKKKNGSKYFLLGDNKKDSLDSKILGWIERKKILGKLIGVITM